MSQPDVEIDVEIDDGLAVVIGNDKDASKPKRKRFRGNQLSSVPEVNGSLQLTVHIITSTGNGDQLTKSRKSISIIIENAGCYLQNVDLDDARNNVDRPFISAQNAHGLVINHLGQRAAENLEKIASGVDPNLSQKLKINSNPEYSVSISLAHNSIT